MKENCGKDKVVKDFIWIYIHLNKYLFMYFICTNSKRTLNIKE